MLGQDLAAGKNPAEEVESSRMSNEERQFRLPRMVKSLGWVALFTDVATEMVYPLLPVFLRSIGAGAQALGLIEGLAESVSAAVKWLFGAI